MPFPYNPYMPNMQGNPYMPQQTPFGVVNTPVMPQMPQAPMNTPPQQYAPQSAAQPPKTNKVFVTSVEEAMARPVEPNTEVIYLHQDQPLLIEVYTDAQGKKTPQLFDLTPHKAQEAAKAPEANYITEEQLKGVQGEIAALKEQIAKLSRRAKKDVEPIE